MTIVAYHRSSAIVCFLLAILMGCTREYPPPGNEEMRNLFQTTLYEKTNRAFFNEGYAAKLDERSLDLVALELLSGSFEAQGTAYRAVMRLRFRLIADPADRTDPRGRAARLAVERVLEVDPARMKAGDEFELTTEKVFLNDGKGWQLAP